MEYKFLLKTTAKLRERLSVTNITELINWKIRIKFKFSHSCFYVPPVHHKYDHLLLQFLIFALTSGWSWTPICQYPSWGWGWATHKMPQWHIDYFALKLFKKQPTQERHSDPPLSPWNQEINCPLEGYPLCPWRVEDILITRDREFRAKMAV